MAVSWAEKEAAIRKLEKNGKVKTGDLIARAQSPKHPCHGDFTWDVQQAAQERWHDQARKLIRRCKFEVIVEDITHPVVRYVSDSDPDEDRVFASLPKMRSVTKVSTTLASEVTALLGVASRVYGIAVCKAGIVGDGPVAKLRMVRDTLAELQAELE